MHGSLVWIINLYKHLVPPPPLPPSSPARLPHEGTFVRASARNQQLRKLQCSLLFVFPSVFVSVYVFLSLFVPVFFSIFVSVFVSEGTFVCVSARNQQFCKI